MEIARAAASRSASSRTMQGSLPPSSRVIFFRPSAAFAITFLPVGVEPVRAILRVSGWPTIASPVACPTTTLTTPSGRPPSIRASMHARVARGVVLAGFSTTVLPAAIAGATLLAARVSGKFHGTIAPQTPIGLRTTSPYVVRSGSRTYCPWILSARSANQPMFSPNRLASRRDSSSVLPCSLVRMTAISSTFLSMWSAALWRISRRWLAGSFDQVANALAAACAALSTSAASPAGTSSTTSPVAGLRTSYVLPDAALVRSPSMIIVAMRHTPVGSFGTWLRLVGNVGEAGEGRRCRHHRPRPTAGEQLRLRVSSRVRRSHRRRPRRRGHPRCRRGELRREVLFGRRRCELFRQGNDALARDARDPRARDVSQDGEHSVRVHRGDLGPLPWRRLRAGACMRHAVRGRGHVSDRSPGDKPRFVSRQRRHAAAAAARRAFSGDGDDPRGTNHDARAGQRGGTCEPAVP